VVLYVIDKALIWRTIPMIQYAGYNIQRVRYSKIQHDHLGRVVYKKTF
jgi:hypothetical protein